jgi:hypothetical protein
MPVKPIALPIVTLFFAVSLSAQSAPSLRFNGHALGETAEAFFSTATAVESKGMTKEYCKSLSNDTTTMKNYEAARTAANKKGMSLALHLRRFQLVTTLRSGFSR